MLKIQLTHKFGTMLGLKAAAMMVLFIGFVGISGTPISDELPAEETIGKINSGDDSVQFWVFQFEIDELSWLEKANSAVQSSDLFDISHLGEPVYDESSLDEVEDIL